MNRKSAPPEPSAAAVVQGAVQPRFGEVHIRQRGHLPHWEKDAGLYFITFRLADSLPKHVLEGIAERQRILISAKQTGTNLLPSQRVLVAEFSPTKREEYLDRGAGGGALRDSRISELMANALRFWNGKRYRLLAWCVMPNHVHVVCRLLPGQDLSTVLHGWKSFTARKANEILARKGAFWQREYYDRLIRDGDELERALRYVARNPERAGLKGWMWVWSAGVDARTTGRSGDRRYQYRRNQFQGERRDCSTELIPRSSRVATAITAQLRRSPDRLSWGPSGPQRLPATL
jgi:REP element-mobilizing transposase RayT